MGEAGGEPTLALISGGSKGLGLAIGKELLDRGHKVVAFSRSGTPQVEELERSHRGRFRFLEGDLADGSSLKRVVDTTEKEIGPIGILINNAGMVWEGLLARQPEEAVARILDVDLKGTLLLTRLAVRHMMIRRYGRIVNISSIVAVRGFRGMAPYSAAKAGIHGMTRALARELGPRNITVNAIAPGYMETDLVQDLNPKQLQQIVRRTPLGRPGRVEDITGVAAFLVSDDAAFMTGQILVVDGGSTV